MKNFVFHKVHPEWLDFFNANREDLENILEQVNKDIDEVKYIDETNDIFPLPKDIFRTLFYFGQGKKLCFLT